MIKFIPLNVVVPNDIIKSDTLGSRSIYDAIAEITEFGVEDVPVLYNLLGDALNDTGIVNFDKEKFKGLKFDETFGTGVLSCLHISKDLFGDLGELDLFNTTPVPETDDPENPEVTDFNPRLFYVIESGSIETEDAVYKRAYTDDKIRVEGTEGLPLYYPALNELDLSEIVNTFTDRFQLLKIKDLVKVLSGATEDSDVVEIFEDKRIKDLGDFSFEEIKLSKLIETPTEENGYANKVIYDVLLDATSFNTETGTYDESKTYENMLVSDLVGGNLDINNVRLSKVLSSDAENPNVILDKILSDDTVRIGNLAEKINDLSLEELYGQEVFTTDEKSVDVRDVNARYSFDEATGTYMLDKDNGEYYLSSKAQVWIFMFYEIGDFDADGYALTYTTKNLTFADLQDGVGNVSGNVVNSTIRQLYLCGMLDTQYDNIMALKTTEVIKQLNEAAGKLPEGSI